MLIQGLLILLVEDDALMGMLLAEMLEEMGHSVCGVESTEAGAVAAAARRRPDLLIADVRLRDGSGIAAVTRILAAGPVRHMFISGERLPIGRPGAVVLEKPFRESELRRAIERVFAAVIDA